MCESPPRLPAGFSGFGLGAPPSRSTFSNEGDGGAVDFIPGCRSRRRLVSL